ncbi:DUF3566 domain-containing protein [Mycolicibacterium sarraceniae]|uniref:DUF3566 domain-containing protein n=1 Tax=Mycolicibacterium sarraceniae TaxID=1534348 RepID=A0A7I7SN72_9MYCO|nr:DUF3566 domain-containing protein [Mycolicibacterium sarraceniae]BBY58444.1 hypothetical protein MSAR_15800 [Mycolicibacterium sarraceniae]
MSAPNEPGQPGPGANGGSGEVPPWQRGATRARQGGAPQRPAGEAQQPRPPAPPQGPPQGPPSSIEARVNRFITGSAAPDRAGAGGPPAPPQQPRPEAARSEGSGSELPDLSGPTPPKPTPPQNKPASDQPFRPNGAAPRVALAANRSRSPVRASMQIRHIDPWSALKVSLLLSVALFFVWMIAVALLYLVLGGMGVWSKLNSNVGDLLTATSGGGGELVSSGTIFGGAALIGLVNIVLLTAMATVGAFIYNLSTDIVGGIEVTLADRD